MGACLTSGPGRDPKHCLRSRAWSGRGACLHSHLGRTNQHCLCLGLCFGTFMAVPPPPVGHRGIWQHRILVSLYDHIYGKDDEMRSEEFTFNPVLDYFSGKEAMHAKFTDTGNATWKFCEWTKQGKPRYFEEHWKSILPSWTYLRIRQLNNTGIAK